MKMVLFMAGWLGILGAPMLMAAKSDSPSRPTVAKKVPKLDTLHGDRRVDDYYWLRDKESPEVLSYLRAENTFTDEVMKPTAALQEALYKEMLARIKQADETVPYRENGYFYYSRTEEGKQYPVMCRRKDAPTAQEEVTIDLNELAREEKFMALGAYAVNDDGRMLAFSIDRTGFRQYTLFIKDLKTGQTLPEQVEKVSSAAWASDGATLFYTVEDSAKRPYRLYRHRLGNKLDELVYEEKDERFRVEVTRSRSGAFIFLTSASHTAAEVRYLAAGEPETPWRVIAAREPEHEYEVDHLGDVFFIRTNSGGRNFRLVSAPVSAPGRQNWKEVVPHRPDVMLEQVSCFAGHYVLYEYVNGLPRIRVVDLKSGAARSVEFPEPAYSAAPGANHEFETRKFRYTYQSFITPSSVYDYDVEQQTSKLLKRTEVLGGYDPSRYLSERIFAPAADGTRIPISLVYKRGAKRDGRSPLLLTGYGSYGYGLPVTFSSNRLSLLDRGATFAIAHIRGGGEMGKAWHDQGRMLSKKNTFTDFIDAAQFLVAEKYTSGDRLIIEGRSAGGLLMGAVTNLRPDLFKAVVSHVPFVDVLNTMLDESLPLTVGEFEEWGNPKKKEEYEYMRSYCPYTNLAAKAYPALLVKTSLNDSQVMYWEPAKYVAKLRALKTDQHPLLFKINMAGGHGGSSGRYDALREVAFDYAFMLGQWGSAP